MMLSSKSAEEIRLLLDDYGIKHGPVVESTRALYEKKLREAIANQRKNKPQTDRTYYREEEEEVTYVQRHRPAQYDLLTDRSRSDYGREDYNDEVPLHRANAYYNMPEPKNSHYDFVRDRRDDYEDEVPLHRTKAYCNMSPPSNSHYDLLSDRTRSNYRRGDFTDVTPTYRTKAYRNMSQTSNFPPEFQSQEPQENGSKHLVPIWLQILVFLIVSGFLYMLFINMEPAEPIKRLT